MKKLLLSLLACLLIFTYGDAGAVPKAKKGKGARKTARHRRAKPTYYYNSDGTLSDKPGDARRPSAYKGDNVPENDGHRKNVQRNINYNSGQPLPSNSGK